MSSTLHAGSGQPSAMSSPRRRKRRTSSPLNSGVRLSSAIEFVNLELIAMNKPILFHDPTSEPSRAVHWLSIEAGLEIKLEYTWLTRDDHLNPRFLATNPGHQVPALLHNDFCIAEASAIMLYLIDVHEIQDRWIGATPEDRAFTHRFLSWHHTNTRTKLTLDYFLPVLLMPAYHGVAPPSSEDLERLRARGRECLGLLDSLIESRGKFVGGRNPNVADFFIASDLFALDLDPERGSWFDGLRVLPSWLERLRETDGYAISHRPWNAIIPRLQVLLSSEAEERQDNRWVADACAEYL